MSCKRIAVYSPEDVKVFLGGVYEVKGFVDDTFISIERISEVFSHKITSDGTVVRSHKGNMAYQITITLSNASESNDVLNKLMLIDFATQVGKFPLMIKDNQGSSLMFSPSTWVEQQPRVDFGVNVTNREWVLVSNYATINVGGNYSQSGVVEDSLNTILGLAGGAGGVGDLGSIIGGALR